MDVYIPVTLLPSAVHNCHNCQIFPTASHHHHHHHYYQQQHHHHHHSIIAPGNAQWLGDQYPLYA